MKKLFLTAFALSLSVAQAQTCLISTRCSPLVGEINLVTVRFSALTGTRLEVKALVDGKEIKEYLRWQLSGRLPDGSVSEIIKFVKNSYEVTKVQCQSGIEVLENRYEKCEKGDL